MLMWYPQAARLGQDYQHIYNSSSISFAKNLVLRNIIFIILVYTKHIIRLYRVVSLAFKQKCNHREIIILMMVNKWFQIWCRV